MTLTPDATALALVDDAAARWGDAATNSSGDQDDALSEAAQTHALARLARIAEQAQDFASRAKAPNTLKAYRNDWADFRQWCAAHRRLSGISQAHQAAGHASPTREAQVRMVFQGIRRTLGSAPTQKTAAVTAELRAMLETLDLESLIGARDRALLLVGFAGAFRRSEPVALDLADVTFTADGLVISCAAPRPTRKPRVARSGCPSARTRSPARCARSVSGSSAPASNAGHSSAPSIATAISGHNGSATSRWRSS